jgi:hypothetical protein
MLYFLFYLINFVKWRLLTPSLVYRTSQINESVYLALHQCGVEIYPGHVVVDVMFSNQHTLQSIQLENKHFDAQSPPERENTNFQDQNGERKDSISDNSNTQSTPQFVKIECATLLCCMRKSCDADVFTAINESGLVYDGGVVVDEVSHINIPTTSSLHSTGSLTNILILHCFTNTLPLHCLTITLLLPDYTQRFCTTDPSIYAIGSYTRFSRVYRNSVPHIR